MNKTYIDNNFLLRTEAARELFHQHAKTQPILDYHNHLPPAQIATNHQFGDLFEIWLAGDHYKWRAMRSNGIAERFCTGDATPREKFDAWASTVPFTLRNPLHHWTHLELMRTFGIDVLLEQRSADFVWNAANAQLASLRVHDILARSHVAALCTTDDPADSLEHHEAIRRSNLATRVYPTFRPDKALSVRDPRALNEWLERLAQVTGGAAIQTLDDLLSALKRRHDDFHAFGARLSDHGLEMCLAHPCSHAEAARIFAAARTGRAATEDEWAGYGALLMLEFGRWDAARSWTKQLHLGALRNANSRQLRTLGPDTGFDTIGDFPQTRALATYLDTLDREGALPRMVLYNLNPADNYAFATMIGSFQDGSVPGKIQFGSGWWFLDQREGMEWQINALSSLGLLRRFIGMLTDSRSFLSFPRHEYFRRVLCNLLGTDMERGDLPADMNLIGTMVREICHRNARDFLRLD